MAAICAALLAGCAAVPSAPTLVAGRASPSAFLLEGRISVRQGETRYHAGISWRHDARSDAIFLSGPLGQGLAELTRNAAGARLVTADRQMIAADDWEGLAERVFGARLPLSNLPGWLAAPAATVGPTPTLEIDGWRIDTLDAAAGRPVLIELRRDDIEVRLKIDAWSPAP